MFSRPKLKRKNNKVGRSFFYVIFKKPKILLFQLLSSYFYSFHLTYLANLSHIIVSDI